MYERQKKIGEYFYGVELLSLEQIETILAFQNNHRELRFGDIAVSLGYLDTEDIENFAQAQ